MKKADWNIVTNCCKFLLISLLIFSCTEEPVYQDIKSTEQVITRYIECNPEFSEFCKILEKTGLNSLLTVRGPFTLFVPSDSQMQEYYKAKGIKSFNELEDEFLRELALNHIIEGYIVTNDIGLGAIREPNAIGDFIVTGFNESDIILNKCSKIIKRDIVTSNGIIHQIDKVLDPITKSVFDIVNDIPAFSLFTEGLVRTKLKDTLQQITLPYGNRMARTRFTILAVADSTFNRYGITNIDELIAYFTNAPDSITLLNNEFYRYMEYHCLANTYYLSDLETNLFPTISYDNYVSITVNDDYKLNLDEDKNYTRFVVEQCNHPGKNGTVHTVAGLLPTTIPKPQTIVWETTDHIEIKESDFYKKNYKRWFDGKNTFPNLKWEGNYLLYYYREDVGIAINNDCLSMSGWWWCEVTTPKIMKGKYKISGNLLWPSIDYDVYIDGIHTALIKKHAFQPTWAEVDWDKTDTHDIKIVARSPGNIFWDTVVFTPLEN